MNCERNSQCEIWIEANLPDPDLIQCVGSLGETREKATIKAQAEALAARDEVCKICRIARKVVRMELNKIVHEL